MPIYALGDLVPNISKSAFVHPDAILIGDVTVGPEATIWPSAVLRGDVGTIEIGARTSIQDGTVIHASHRYPTSVGTECVVGHLVHLEGCTIAERCLIGSGSILLNQVEIGKGAVVAAGAVVREGTIVAPYTLVAGVPSTERGSAIAFSERIQGSVERYVARGAQYSTDLRQLG